MGQGWQHYHGCGSIGIVHISMRMMSTVVGMMIDISVGPIAAITAIAAAMSGEQELRVASRGQ